MISKGIRQARAKTCTARPELMSLELFNLRLGQILATSRQIFFPRETKIEPNLRLGFDRTNYSERGWTSREKLVLGGINRILER